MKNFLFDVDGTLTPAREKMADDFHRFFIRWFSFRKHMGDNVYLVTGSDKDKTIWQVGRQIWAAVDGSYQNCGNELYKDGELIRRSDWQMSATLHLDILEIIEDSRWFGKAETNIEERIGMINISTVGRSASKSLRKEYYEWDKRNEERKAICRNLSMYYPNLDFAIGGEISIDIYPKGKDKSQVLDDMSGKTIFFGDKCGSGGNDEIIASKSDIYFYVDNYKTTWDILKKDYQKNN
jgi:phosphomannomutase